jgi:hypothetical protein
MPKFASICGVIVIAAVALATVPALAAGPPAEAGAQPTAPSAPPKGYECHDTALSGSGPGFKDSQEESEQAAIKDWLEKAKAVYPDADWKTTLDPRMECVKQGLYSKCFAIAKPCHPKPQ